MSNSVRYTAMIASIVLLLAGILSLGMVPDSQSAVSNTSAKPDVETIQSDGEKVTLVRKVPDGIELGELIKNLDQIEGKVAFDCGSILKSLSHSDYLQAKSNSITCADTDPCSGKYCKICDGDGNCREGNCHAGGYGCWCQ